MLEGGPPVHRLSPARPAPAAGARAGATVLVVDDDDAIRDFLRSALECEGYGVLAAGDGLDALALCERYAPDVILLDLMMPRLSGLAFLARYRERFGAGPEAGVPGTPDVPIYVMSAVRAAVDEAAAAGVAGTFVKPFDLDELLETVGAAVERRRLERLSALAVPLTPAAQRTRHAPPRSVGRPR